METRFFRASSGRSGGLNDILSGMFDSAKDLFDFVVYFHAGV